MMKTMEKHRGQRSNDEVIQRNNGTERITETEIMDMAIMMMV